MPIVNGGCVDLGQLPRSKKRFEEKNHKKTDFAEDIVNVAVMFCEPFGELVVLFRERPDVDAAERVRLRERQREREA